MLASRLGARTFLARSTASTTTTATRTAFRFTKLASTTPVQCFHSTPCYLDEAAKKQEPARIVPEVDDDAVTKHQSTAITGRQRIVVAVGGNALQRRGERLTIEK